MEVVIKAFLQEAGLPVEVRRILISTSDQGNKGIFKETFAKVGSTFPGLHDKIFSLKWKDSDGDLVMMSSDEEMTEALTQAQNSPLKVFITVEGVKEGSSEDLEDVLADASEEPSTSEKKEGDHQKQDPFSGPFESGFCDPMSFFGMRKRGHPDSHNPRGHFGFHFGHMGPRGHHSDHLGPRGHHSGHMGPRGHHFGHMGPRGHHFDHAGQHFGHMGPRGHHFGPTGSRGHHFASMGPRGHHFGPMGPCGHPGFHGGNHFGHHMGMQSPFGQDFFEGQQPYHPLQAADVYFGHHFGHHHDRRHHEENGWKATLRDAVPVTHRRWAKTYIRTWRVKNLENATSTSGESDQEILTMEAASVPEAYAAWLDIFLPKWHSRQGQVGASPNIDKEKNAEEKQKLKASVPLEFRKWAKWYLARHFGKKDAPKFRKECPFEGKMEKMRKKDWKKSFKMQTLAVSIPSEHRLWARTFIRDWRQEHKVQGSKLEDNISTENETTEKKAADGSVAVPDDYTKWMHKFLTKWHLTRGQVDEQNVELDNGKKGEFKDTVPKHFRKWVKCFMWHQYGKGAERKEGSIPSQYEKLLQAFQNRWIQEQSKGSSDECLLTGSDDDTAGFFWDETEQEMESSLKKLRLDREQANNTTDSDNSELEGIRDWFKEAIWRWDGRTAPGFAHEGAAEAEQISPHLYKWMAKMMMKKQKKMMKKEFKKAKHSMKAVMKAHKYGH